MLRLMQKIIVICLFAATGIVDAGVYRWVDQNGQIHFSDQPRAGASGVMWFFVTDPSGNRVEITAEGRVTGDLRAPRILIADGAQYKGNIDMG